MPRVTKITNAAPLVVDYGTGDGSFETIPLAKTPIPQHLPVVYIQSKKGRLGPQLVTTAERLQQYGNQTFDTLGPYTNHQTILSNRMAENGNIQIVERCTNGEHANATLWLDIVEEPSVPLFDRDASGAIIYDNLGAPSLSGSTTAGYRARWVVTSEAGLAANETRNGDFWPTFGTKTPVPGSLGGSTMYPIADFVLEEPGEAGNDVGISIWNTGSKAAVNVDEYSNNYAFPFSFAILNRYNNRATPKRVENIYGGKETKFSFSPFAIDSLSNASYQLSDIIENTYNNTTDGNYGRVLGDIENFSHVYTDNVSKILDDCMTTELAYLDAQGIAHDYPFDGTSYDNTRGHQYIFNFIDGKNIDGHAYHTFMIDSVTSVVDGIHLTKNANIMFKNGTDNIMTVADYELSVIEKVARYADPEDYVQDMAHHEESILYDSGFTMATKLELTDFISQRKDTFYVAQTHVDTIEVRGARDRALPGAPLPEGSDKALTLEQEISSAIALTTRMAMLPESDYFGTPVMRGCIMGGSGKIRNSRWKHRTGFSYDLCAKASGYMGAANGKWKSGKAFARAPGNHVRDLYDININWISPSKRVRNWDLNLVMPLNYDRDMMFIPNIQTVYPDDTSVLNNFTVAMAICAINKAAHATWREFAGVDDLTDRELTDAVNAHMLTLLSDRFDDRYDIIPRAYISADDKLRGYSWHLPTEIHANMSKTAMTTWVKAFRKTTVQER